MRLLTRTYTETARGRAGRARFWGALALGLALFAARARATTMTVTLADADFDGYSELLVDGSWVLAVFQNQDPRDMGFHGAMPFIVKGFGNVACSRFGALFDVEHIFISGYDLRVGREAKDGLGAAWHNHWPASVVVGDDDPFAEAPGHLTVRSEWTDAPASGVVSGETGLRFVCDWGLLENERTVLQRVAVVNDGAATASATMLVGYPGITFPARNPNGSVGMLISAEGRQWAYQFRDGAGFAESEAPRHYFSERRVAGALSVEPPEAPPWQLVDLGGGRLYCYSTLLNPEQCNSTGVGTINDAKTYHSTSLLNLFNQIDIPPGRQVEAFLVHRFTSSDDLKTAIEAGPAWAEKQRSRWASLLWRKGETAEK